MSDWKAYLQRLGAHFSDDRHVDFGDSDQARHAHDDTVITPLVHMGILQLAGADAERFLQGQTSAQLSLANGDFAAPTAFCTPKGRMLANAQLLRVEEGRYWLLIDRDLIDPLRNHLAKFAAFYKADITPRDDIVLLGLIGRDAPALVETRMDLRPPTTWQQVNHGERVVLRHPGHKPRLLLCLPQDEAGAVWDTLAKHAIPVGNAVWQLHDIQAGLVWLNAAHQDTYLPQMINWEALGGISFKKGCYTGQEVVARAHFRGQVKKRLVRGQLDGATLPDIGTPILDAEGKSQGEVVSAEIDGYGEVEILAVMTTRDDLAEPLTVLDQHLKRLKLPYPLERVDPENLASNGQAG
ncbi:folate-binding protein [Halomonas sp. McH1-25]|uniref:CAF17-like 4Fe-4S cluster assembly/insertion protein YgfZ n=1 Tax=unclassified Halomonas TaxID=2609666 RepID=UPI001EF6B9B2|nr:MULTISPECIES: folate-binding protein [unclassified Halomonas]MCG7598522.1 folate-binding protein [Halomonas sp. McH1-25]MCP1341774.1 folate-binding protein [Halomonas sp. FL8]MCP1360991.1 folate-binding protein [Halomonas sp. BBD45]MCP1364211.1 folate-binding protein [Halomonas sp. BBD48]